MQVLNGNVIVKDNRNFFFKDELFIKEINNVPQSKPNTSIIFKYNLQHSYYETNYKFNTANTIITTKK